MPETRYGMSGNDLTYSIDSTTGLPVPDKSTGQAKHVILGELGVNHNRNIPAATAVYATATNTATWAGIGIKELNIFAVTYPCRVVYGALDAGAAAAALADAGTLSTDILWDYVPAGVRYNKLLSASITRVDILPIGGTTALHIEAV
jgi:hypothetical protein